LLCELRRQKFKVCFDWPNIRLDFVEVTRFILHRVTVLQGLGLVWG